MHPIRNSLIALAVTGSLLTGVVSLSAAREQTIDQKLQSKTGIQRIAIRSDEVVKSARTGMITVNGITMNIQSVQRIDGGVQAFVQAWKDGEPVGFGDDGTVEIERFRIFNPPTLVDDPNGSIERLVTNEVTKETFVRRLREDPNAALRETLANTISLVGKDGSNIIPGKVGNTTSTFYPDANVESTSVDGYIENYADPGTCSTMAGAAAGTSANDSGTNVISQYSDVGPECNIQRGATLFDTSSIPDADTVSSAVVSLRGLFIGNTNSYSVRVVTLATVSNTSLSVNDFNDFGTTSLANEITVASFSTAGYNDFTLTDLTQVSKTGVSKLGFRLTGDISAGSPTGANYAQSASADTAGTTSDPKLVVTHAASAVPAPHKMIIID